MEQKKSVMPLTATNFNFPGQKDFYKGKVRDVYNINNNLLIMIVTDRISAFDVILPAGIPSKGQVLNQIASKFLDHTSDIVPNWKTETPDPMVTAGTICEPFQIEMVIRGYLCGHAWREYKSGKRTLCGEKMPEGMRENQAFETPLITPTTKATQGHDMDISKDEILAKQIISADDYEKLEHYTQELFKRGSQWAAERGLILADTKYEFGKKNGVIHLIDEIHTPDSSRYFYTNEYAQRLADDQPQKQLSKEFVREWLIKQGFQGKPGQTIPEMSADIVQSISQRYIELYEIIMGEKFQQQPDAEIHSRIEKNCLEFLSKH